MRKTLILAILVVLPLTFHGCDKNGTTVELPPPVKTDDKDKGGDSGNTGGETKSLGCPQASLRATGNAIYIVSDR